MKTPIITMGGCFGFCGGAWLGAFLVERWGFKGLHVLLPVAGAACLAVPLARHAAGMNLGGRMRWVMGGVCLGGAQFRKGRRE